MKIFLPLLLTNQFYDLPRITRKRYDHTYKTTKYFIDIILLDMCLVLISQILTDKKVGLRIFVPIVIRMNSKQYLALNFER